MRSNEERVAAVKWRSKELEQESRKHRGQVVRLASIAAGLTLIVCLSFVMPGIVGSFSDDVAGDSTMTASIFQGGGALGYIVIGILAFVLGVCVTVVCYHSQRSEREENVEKTKQGNDDD